MLDMIRDYRAHAFEPGLIPKHSGQVQVIQTKAAVHRPVIEYIPEAEATY